MIKEISNAASEVGITAFVTNSTERIESQLNRITGIEQLPIMLVSWDYETTINIDANGFLENPNTNIVCLLMTKAESREKVDLEEASEQMGVLFSQFVRVLNNNLKTQTRDGLNSLSTISYKNVPSHGAGKHSGVLGRFTMRTPIEQDCTVCKPIVEEVVEESIPEVITLLIEAQAVGQNGVGVSDVVDADGNILATIEYADSFSLIDINGNFLADVTDNQIANFNNGTFGAFSGQNLLVINSSAVPSITSITPLVNGFIIFEVGDTVNLITDAGDVIGTQATEEGRSFFYLNSGERLELTNNGALKQESNSFTVHGYRLDEDRFVLIATIGSNGIVSLSNLQ